MEKTKHQNSLVFNTLEFSQGANFPHSLLRCLSGENALFDRMNEAEQLHYLHDQVVRVFHTMDPVFVENDQLSAMMQRPLQELFDEGEFFYMMNCYIKTFLLSSYLKESKIPHEIILEYYFENKKYHRPAFHFLLQIKRGDEVSYTVDFQGRSHVAIEAGAYQNTKKDVFDYKQFIFDASKIDLNKNFKENILEIVPDITTEIDSLLCNSGIENAGGIEEVLLSAWKHDNRLEEFEGFFSATVNSDGTKRIDFRYGSGIEHKLADIERDLQNNPNIQQIAQNDVANFVKQEGNNQLDPEILSFLNNK